jgi:photosystem II stability/assembly factor-like uncharacterized protein
MKRRATKTIQLLLGAGVVVLTGALAVALPLLTSPAGAASFGDPDSYQTSGTTQDLSAVSFVNLDDGWAVGASGTILATTDGGVSWSPETSNTTVNLSGVSFVNASDGWAVGGAGTGSVILATVDGGADWTTQLSCSTGSCFQLLGVSFVDPNDGWVARQSGAEDDILATTDGGAHWAVQPSSVVPGCCSAVTFVNANDGWAAGQGLVMSTTDGGSTWTAVSIDSDSTTFTGVSFADAMHGCIVGHDDLELAGVTNCTSDGGATWTAPCVYTDDEFNGVAMAGPSGAWAVGSGKQQGVAFQWNGSLSSCFTAQNTASDTTGLGGISMPYATDGWAVGRGGVITAMAPASALGLGLSPSSVVADGTSTTTATVSAHDRFGNPLPCGTVTLTTSGDATIGAVTDQGGGTYTATITASGTSDTETITATCGSLTATATLTETPCYTIMTTADSGTCSLREAILGAAASGQAQTITAVPRIGGDRARQPDHVHADGADHDRRQRRDRRRGRQRGHPRRRRAC